MESTGHPQLAQRLLEVCNEGSARVAVIHTAFILLCAYVLVIVFSTTDLELLVGKSVTLPLVDVDVPIVGFFAVAPYLILLAHFNLLLQLQLLARKLYALDALVSNRGDTAAMREHLHIFPFTYHLIGAPAQLITSLLGLAVTVTVLLLPLITFLALQLRFLAYQSELVTWGQRFATWLDVMLVSALWPIVMDKQSNWIAYLRRLGCYVRHRPVQTLLWESFLVLFVIAVLTQSIAVFLYCAAGLLLVLSILVVLKIEQRIRVLIRGRKTTFIAGPKGGGGLVFVCAAGTILPIIFLIPGERAEAWVVGGDATTLLPSIGLEAPSECKDIDDPFLYLDSKKDSENRFFCQTMWFGDTIASVFLDRYRRLDVSEQTILAKDAGVEDTAKLRNSDTSAKVRLEPIDLSERNLRRAVLDRALLSNVDLRGANLSHALLREATLVGARLDGANLRGAILRGSQLDGASLVGAILTAADLSEASLAGANLRSAELVGADLSATIMLGANLSFATLRGATLKLAKLNGADLSEADLRGATFMLASLDAASLRGAHLNGTSRLNGMFSGVGDVDIRGVRWEQLDPARLAWDTASLAKAYMSDVRRASTSNSLMRAASKATACHIRIGACLVDETAGPELSCQRETSLELYRVRAHEIMIPLVCEIPAIAASVMTFARPLYEDPLEGLAAKLLQLSAKDQCPAVKALGPTFGQRLRRLEKEDER